MFSVKLYNLLLVERSVFNVSDLWHVSSSVSRFPVMGLLIFGALCLVAILMLVLISQQEK